MTNKKTTKQQLVASIVLLFMCFSMLLGTTFAWFTDSVTSAGNIIKTGTLDVEMYWAEGKEDPNASATVWEDASKGPMFSPEELWEPGYVAARQIKISNKGTLDLKYNLNIVANGEVSELADVIDVYFIDPATKLADRTALAADKKIGTLTEVLAGINTGKLGANTLKAGDDAVVTIALKMQETAGNEYQDLGIGSSFSIQLLATQMASEDDSFDNQYDNGAYNTIVYDAAQIKSALEQGDSVKLGTDISVDETLAVPAGSVVKLDLNGKKLTGAMHKDTGAVIKNSGTLTIKNGTISSTADNGGSALVNNGTAALDDVTLNGAPNANGSWPSYTVNNTGVMFVKDSKITSYHGAVASYGDGALVTLNNCEIDMAGIPGFTSHGIYTYNNGSVVVNGGVYANKATDQASTGASVINGAVTVNSGTFYGRVENYYGTPVINGGSYSVKPNDKFIADGYKASKVGDLYYVTETNANFVVDTDGLVAAINDPDITKVYLANGEYALRFTNQVGFNVDGMEFVGAGDDVKLSITSTEVWYGRVQGDGVTFENIHFISTVGATGKAVYNNCVFDSWAICASSGNMKTYYNDCTIKECLNASSDFSSGNVYVNDSVVTKAEYSFSSDSSAMYFENCEIGEIIPWDANTVLQGCKIEKLVTENMVNNEIITITEDDNGVLYSTTTADENVLTLYRVPADYAETTFNVPAGVTNIGGYAFAYNDNVKTVVLASTVRELGRGFDSSKVEKVVLNEGLTTISARAFRSTPNLQEVVISSTVTTIADNAFQKSGVKTITIPANVKTVGEAAFGASKIETVIFEGNTKIEGYAFRGCPNLRTVYLNGMDVNFVASSLNGRNSMWFCNSESNNPNTSNITFYVKTDVIKERVLTAMGAERNNTTVIVEMTTEEGGYITDSEGNAFAYDAPALDDALADGKNVTLAGNLTFNSNETSANSGYGATGVTVNGSVLDGNGYSLGVNNWGTWDSAINITSGTIKNVIVNKGMRGIFISHNGTAGKVYLENVIIDGTVYTISCDQGTNSGLEAKNSTFNGWTSYAATIGDVKFVDCSFGEGQGYAFCRPYAPTKFVGCDFEAGFEIDPRAAVTFENCTIDGVALTAENLATLVTSNIANASVK